MTKNTILLQAVAVLMAIGSVACSGSRNTTSGNPSSTRTSRGQIPSGQYPGGVFPGIPSPSRSAAGLPPGQAKKIDGAQSAKAYAPGQQKKAGVKGKGKVKKQKKGKKS